MSRVLPILFNTDMVRAILDGRKTVTRRLVKVPPYYPHFYKLHDNTDGALSGTRDRLYAGFYKDEQIFFIDGEKHVDAVYYQAPYQPGDILYVRETWCWCPCWDCGMDTDEHNCCHKTANKFFNHDKGEYGCYGYKASFEDNEYPSVDTWHPSIHMPKEAARIWLKVKDVRVERLREMKPVDVIKEGAYPDCWDCLNTYGESGSQCCYGTEEQCSQCDEVMMEWEKLWNSTIKKSDLDRYGLDANPWVWVIEFERCERPEN